MAGSDSTHPRRPRGRPPKSHPSPQQQRDMGRSLVDYMAGLPEGEARRKLPLLAYAVAELGPGRPIGDYIARAHALHKHRKAAIRATETLREWYAVGDLVRSVHLLGVPLRENKGLPGAFEIVAEELHRSIGFVQRAYNFARSFRPGFDPFGNFPKHFEHESANGTPEH